MLVESFEKEFGKKLVWVNVNVSSDWFITYRCLPVVYPPAVYDDGKSE